VLIQTHTGDPIFIDWGHADKLPIGFDLSRLLISVPPGAGGKRDRPKSDSAFYR